eukprot:CAMPEP_0176054716 /NCGR_PEP_ID=MMETSP0120_2-20121206/27228_1 /TAXON_ID=160619 /ORGANISM="Kryptoperidinium foliaceum, Strain CCMP 1326" /LENGTH=386 /DNA_ID=CAMNT_0017388189 /DNA_START=81 /DNA_END=1239 /DNA_ORIENTATION=+
MASSCASSESAPLPASEAEHPADAAFGASAHAADVHPNAAFARLQLFACAKLLADARAEFLGPEDASVAGIPAPEMTQPHAMRQALLEEKRALGVSMEALRSTMRSLQEEGETCTTRARASAADYLASECLLLAVQDNFRKVRNQLRRSREQVEEHEQANDKFRQQLEACAFALGDTIAQESEAHEAMRQEVEQLRQVTEDLEARLRTKASEIERLSGANAVAVRKVGAATERWRLARRQRASDVDRGPIGICLSTLRDVASRLGPDSALALPSPQSGHCGAWLAQTPPPAVPAPSEGERLQRELQDTIHTQLWEGLDPVCKIGEVGMDLPTLRRLVSNKEEHLAVLHRKIRLLAECGASDAEAEHDVDTAGVFVMHHVPPVRRQA